MTSKEGFIPTNNPNPNQGNGKKRRILNEKTNILNRILCILNLKTSPERVISSITSEIEAQAHYYKRVQEICTHLTQCMKYFYGERVIKVVPFGSSVTTLALRDSDVDIFVDFGNNLPGEPKVFVRTLKNKISKNKMFYRSIAIPAIVPIVQSIHKSGITCDISFLNGLGVSDSKLVKFIIQIDRRIKPLILIIKFLMKEKGLIGTNALTSFALLVLVIFFLQQLEEPIIPSIYYLQQLATKREYVADWDTSFTEDLTHLPTISNSCGITKLFHKFFEFYATFEFGLYVISPFTAKMYLKPLFDNPKFLPSEFDAYKRNLERDPIRKFEWKKCMCVQNFFNQSHNITRSVSQQILQRFQTFCRENTSAYSESESSENHMSQYFKKLFEKNIENHKHKKFNQEDIVIYIGDNLYFTNPNCAENELRDNWIKSSLNNVIDVLVKVLKCKINLNSEGNSNSKIFNFKDEILRVLECEFNFFELITKKRNEVRLNLQFPQNITQIDQEEIISNYLCDKVLKGANNVSLKFDVICVAEKRPTCIHLYLQSKETVKSKINLLKQVFQFVRTFLPKWIK